MRGSRLKPISLATHQQGFTLFIVMIMMLVIAFLVIASMQSTNTEMRISSNDADRKYALQSAEDALREGEARIVTERNAGFSDTGNTCADGVCGGQASSVTPIWEQDIWGGASRTPSAHCTQNNGSDRSCYVIERLGAVIDNGAVYRVTSRAWGRNSNTIVTLQSYVKYQE